MKKNFFIYLIYLLSLFVFPTRAMAEEKNDIIVTTKSERIDATVLEVSETEIRYKKASNPTGPTFVISTEKIASILYKNGEVQVFSGKTTSSSKSSTKTPTNDNAVTSPTNNTTSLPEEQRENLYLVTSKGNLNVRKAASSEASVIGTVKSGDTITVINTTEKWAEIQYGSRNGFVSALYIKALPQEQASTTDVAQQNSTIKWQYTSEEKGDTISAKEKQEENKLTPTKSKWLAFYVELNGDVQPKPIAGGFGADAQVGLNTKDINFVGLGLGVRGIFANTKSGSTTYKSAYAYMPIYANDKFYFYEGKANLYIDFSIGGYVQFKPTVKTVVSGKVVDKTKYDGGGGFYLRAGLGASHEGTQYGLGYELFASKGATSHAIYIKFGLGSM